MPDNNFKSGDSLYIISRKILQQLNNVFPTATGDVFFATDDSQWAIWRKILNVLNQVPASDLLSNLIATNSGFNPFTSLGFQLGFGDATLTTFTDYAVQTTGGVIINGCTALKTVSFPNLTTVFSTSLNSLNFQIINNPALTSISLPNLVTAQGSVRLNNNSALTSITIPKYVAASNAHDFYSFNALSVTAVNAILATYAANTAFTTGSLALQGGTNAAPTGQGLVDKATIIARGASVQTN
jgi:hypothetical protein